MPLARVRASLTSDDMQLINLSPPAHHPDKPVTVENNPFAHHPIDKPVTVEDNLTSHPPPAHPPPAHSPTDKSASVKNNPPDTWKYRLYKICSYICR